MITSNSRVIRHEARIGVNSQCSLGLFGIQCLRIVIRNGRLLVSRNQWLSKLYGLRPIKYEFPILEPRSINVGNAYRLFVLIGSNKNGGVFYWHIHIRFFEVHSILADDL